MLFRKSIKYWFQIYIIYQSRTHSLSVRGRQNSIISDRFTILGSILEVFRVQTKSPTKVYYTFLESALSTLSRYHKTVGFPLKKISTWWFLWKNIEIKIATKSLFSIRLIWNLYQMKVQHVLFQYIFSYLP